MRNATPSLVLVLVLLAAMWTVTAGRGSGGGAACAASMPVLEASPAQATPGETLHVHGEGFYGDFICDDSGEMIPPRPAGGRPTDGIRIELLQGTKSWTLATVASDEKLEFDAEGLTLPPDVAPGEAVVRATSPSVAPSIPPQAETPLLVLDGLPETGGPTGAPGG